MLKAESVAIDSSARASLRGSSSTTSFANAQAGLANSYDLNAESILIACADIASLRGMSLN
jgi:hypothetical protein